MGGVIPFHVKILAKFMQHLYYYLLLTMVFFSEILKLHLSFSCFSRVADKFLRSSRVTHKSSAKLDKKKY